MGNYRNVQMRYNLRTLSKLRHIAKIMDMAPTKPSNERSSKPSDKDAKDEEELDEEQEKDDERGREDKKPRS